MNNFLFECFTKAYNGFILFLINFKKICFFFIELIIINIFFDSNIVDKLIVALFTLGLPVASVTNISGFLQGSINKESFLDLLKIDA